MTHRSIIKSVVTDAGIAQWQTVRYTESTKQPQQEAKVTILKLASGRIQSISYWNPESEPVDNFLK